MADREQLCPKTFISQAFYKMLIRENSLKCGSTRRIRKDWKGQMGKDGRGGWLMGNIIPLDGNIVSAVRNK